jgi:hypothetical protein
MMTTDRESPILHYKTALATVLARKRPGMDKKGLAVALAFLIAVSLWGLWRIQQKTQEVTAWQERPNLSTDIDLRPGIKRMPEDGPTQPLQTP